MLDFFEGLNERRKGLLAAEADKSLSGFLTQLKNFRFFRSHGEGCVIRAIHCEDFENFKYDDKKEEWM